jgi:nicotinate-nucleotide pyrophosphorylase (carboxylating)
VTTSEVKDRPVKPNFDLHVNDFLPLVRMALVEDVGSGDITTSATVAPGQAGSATILQKSPGCIFGHGVASAVFTELDPNVRYEELVVEGEWREGGEVARIEGSLAAILTGERTALNFLMDLSGVATLAARAVRAVEGTGAKILDTRKTVPGMRRLQKAAVAAGGAHNHRLGLFDAVLIKENHIKAAGGLRQAVAACRAASDLSVEVECESLQQVREAIEAGAHRILLDNMTDDELREAVQLGHELADGDVEFEASGGYNPGNARSAAETGVDFISMGALTHAAPALDLSLLVS